MGRPRSAESASFATGSARRATEPLSGGDQKVRGDAGYLEDPDAPRRTPGGESVGRFHVTDLHVQIRRCPKPVVAMVAGYAVGGGHVLHVVCDLTIAADNAKFGEGGPGGGSFDGGFGAS